MRKQTIKTTDVLTVLSKIFMDKDNLITKFINDNEKSLPNELKKYQVSVSDSNIMYINLCTLKDKWESFELYIPENSLLKTEEFFNFKTFFSILKPLFFHRSINIENFYSNKDEYDLNYYDKDRQSASYYLELKEKPANDNFKYKKMYCGLFLLSTFEIQQISGSINYVFRRSD
jgi:hypothetical protein